MRKNLLFLPLFLLANLFVLGCGAQLIAEQNLDTLDRQKLAKAIKSDLYTMFVLEMGIISKDWKNMAQGNEKLKEDLKVLYKAFNGGVEDARYQLEEFCKKWKLSIKMGCYE